MAARDSVGVRYGGPPLGPGERYYWTVRSWTSDDEPSGWAPVEYFGIGLTDWVASPIWSSHGDWAFLRRIVRPRSAIQWATLFVTGRSTEPGQQYVYRLSINGSLVSVGPPWTSGGQTCYLAHDVTDLLAPEQTSAIAVLAHTTVKHGVLAQLIIKYTDGSTEMVGTDRSWRALAGDGVMIPAGSICPVYSAPQEHVDQRRWPAGFSDAAFDDGSWPPAVAKPAFAGLTPYAAAPLIEKAVPPMSIKPSGGGYLIDFGRTVIGGLRWRVTGSCDDVMVATFGEELQPDGTLLTPMRTANDYRDQWWLRDGEQTLHTWGYRVFRYVHVSGLSETSEPDAISAMALLHPFDRTAATFQSSDPNLDQVWQFCKDSIEALNFDLYMDSGSRERLPYEMDAHLQQSAHLALDAGWPLARHSLEWLLPTDRATWPTEWKFHSVLAAHAMWMETGDLSWLRTIYPLLKAKLPLAYLNPSGLVEKSVTTPDLGTDIVDWPPNECDSYVFSEINTVVNCFAYRCFVTMAEMSAALGDAPESNRFARLATRIRTGINDQLFDEQVGAYRDGIAVPHHSTHASAFAVALGVATERELAPAGNHLASRGMRCSVFAAPFLIEALFASGRAVEGLKLLTSAGPRSWIAMIEQGAGSVMESWHPSVKPNTTFSHPATASPAFLVRRTVLGIRPTAPGYTRFVVAPQLGHLTSASLTAPTVRGAIAVDITVDESTRLTCTVPGGTVADLVVPYPHRGPVTVIVDGQPIRAVADGTSIEIGPLGSGEHTVVLSRI